MPYNQSILRYHLVFYSFQVVGPLRDAEIFITEDFALLEKLVSGISKKILKKIDTKSGTPSK